MPSSIEPLSLPSSTITPAQTTFEDGVPEIKDVPALGPKKTGSPSKPLPKRLSHRSSWLRYPHWPASSSSTQCLPTSENCGLNQHQPCDTWLLLLLLLLLLLEVAVFLIKRTVPTESRCFISSSQRVLSLEGEWQRGNLVHTQTRLFRRIMVSRFLRCALRGRRRNISTHVFRSTVRWSYPSRILWNASINETSVRLWRTSGRGQLRWL
ncbi:hypothetical protein AUEXF2481DRAFT_497120 [Aureobasidium subglaciale EXF-2481]|uniref:Uncharacterized protein n=1 Tax=Aureobasidium subglaciale (strain EXF-2481) TaxID=1043005 RepID=A0A074YWU1_AURSE|nr:uncharacterized protein AUEXF2481DRAFT_497120 [Aureobasidium subglaciale EXF-2481]KEQ98612.1 hypothetical protein AUEXF2481DRAFT_497120 [Aureobasidium subglaciale EXF-2481]